MDRKSFLTLSSALIAGTLCGAAGTSHSRKKGIGLANKKQASTAELLRQLNPAWHYNWGSNRQTDEPAGIDFVPMVWGGSINEKSMASLTERNQAQGAKALLGFNEPDGKDQANMTVAKALDLWPLLMKSPFRLGSPAGVHPDREWMVEFIKGVEDRKLRVDFITMHSYAGLDVDGLINRVQKVSKQFNRPVWITEFAVADWSAKSREQNRYRPEQVLEFMTKVFPRLEKLDCLERHAWFTSNPESAALGPSALLDQSGKLTALGEYYAQF
jgi:hypothetical protein